MPNLSVSISLTTSDEPLEIDDVSKIHEGNNFYVVTSKNQTIKIPLDLITYIVETNKAIEIEPKVAADSKAKVPKAQVPRASRKSGNVVV